MKRGGLDCEQRSWYFWAAVVVVVFMATALAATLPAFPLFSAWTSLGIPLKIGRWVQQTPLAGLAPGVRALVVCSPDVLTVSLLALVAGRYLPNTWFRWSFLVVLVYAMIRLWVYPCFPWGYVIFFFANNVSAPASGILLASVIGVPLFVGWLSSKCLTQPWFPQSKCYRCGYDLRGLNSMRCPECGTPFDGKNAVDDKGQ